MLKLFNITLIIKPWHARYPNKVFKRSSRWDNDFKIFVTISKGVISNYVILSVIEAAQEALNQGESWVVPFETLPNMPPMALEMLRIGMETDINDMVIKIVEFLNDDINITMGKIVKVLPEVSMAIMGVVMIAFIILVMGPIMELYTGAFLFDAYGM